VTDAAATLPGAWDEPSPHVDARAKLMICIGFVLITVSTPADNLRVLGGLAGFALLMAVMLRVRPGALVRRLLHLAPFVLVVAAAPLLRHGVGMDQAIGIMAKAGLGCCALVMLSASTPVDELLAALAALRCPRLVVLLLGLTARYLHVLSEEAARIRRAAVARGFSPRHLWQARIIGDLIGALFLRSHARAERVHAAMLARGFTGDLVLAPPLPLRAGDVAIVVLLLGTALTWRLVG
jgi:cobalt/nickel transport system permease protein